MDEHKGKWELQTKKVRFLKHFLKVEALGACDRDSFSNIYFCWLHITYIKCRNRTFLLLNEKDQDVGKIG